MKREKLVKFLNSVDEQFNSEKKSITAAYAKYLQDLDDPHKTICIESFGVAMICEYNKDVIDKTPYMTLYNFINSYRRYMMDRKKADFQQKPDYCVEFYTHNFLAQVDSFGYNKIEAAVNYENQKYE